MRQHGTVQAAGESTGQQQQTTGWSRLHTRFWLIPVLFRSVPLPTPEKTILAPTHALYASQHITASTHPLVFYYITTTQQQQAAALKKEQTKY